MGNLWDENIRKSTRQNGKNEAKDGELQTITHTNGRTYGQTTHKR